MKITAEGRIFALRQYNTENETAITIISSFVSQRCRCYIQQKRMDWRNNAINYICVIRLSVNRTKLPNDDI